MNWRTSELYCRRIDSQDWNASCRLQIYYIKGLFEDLVSKKTKQEIFILQKPGRGVNYQE